LRALVASPWERRQTENTQSRPDKPLIKTDWEGNAAGRGFVSAHRRVSAPVTDFIDDHAPLKPIVGAALLPSADVSEAALSTGLALKVATVGAVLVASCLMVVWLQKKAAAVRFNC
jgi:hypothetical protein